MKCERCPENLFYIQTIPCCDDCSENGAYDEFHEEFTHDLKTIETEKLTRNQVEENGECSMGRAYGSGCHLYICVTCKHKTYLPMMEGC